MKNAWDNLEPGFQIAFEVAWEAYKNKTIPIGAAIMDTSNTLVATGRNQIYTEGEGAISLHQIAHAEINAILKLSEIKDDNIHKNIRTYTLYTTMEPCPLCFGAIVMGSIRNIKYAARDNWAGATSLNESIDYIKNKKITVTGPFEEAEIVQIAMHICHELEISNKHYDANVLVQSWKKVCTKGVGIGKYLYDNNTLQDMRSHEFKDVYNFISAKI